MIGKKATRRILMFTLLGFTYAACGPGGQRQSQEQLDTTADTESGHISGDILLIPGESAGDIHLFESDSSLLETLGKPDYSDAAMGKALLVWHAGGDSVRYPLSVFTARDMGNDETARIQQIRITSPFYTTAEGICASSTLDEIANHYQTEPVETYEHDGQLYTVHDSKQGIAFEVGPDDRCVAVIIHSRDADATSYLPLRSFE